MTPEASDSSELLNEHELIQQRRAKLARWREKGKAYPNDFQPDHKAGDIHEAYEKYNSEQLATLNKTVKLAGRIMLKRTMGKAAFVHIQDRSGRIQIYIRENELDTATAASASYEEFKTWDIGDIIGIQGTIFKTKTQELSIKADKIILLTKSLRALPDKFHGLADQELKYRQRYVDLLMNEKTRQTFLIRSQTIDFIRNFLRKNHYIEVETPMMHPIPGGAAAKPFITHHNALDMTLYLRIAPELYLKKLITGGLERVFEINRNFRNEGLSTRHNPEFTMVEFYQAYATYLDLMALTENMMRELVSTVLGKTTVHYQDHTYDFSQDFERLTLLQAIIKFNPDIAEKELSDIITLKKIALKLNIPVTDEMGIGKIQLDIFEKTVEHRLIQPTFITAYPAEVSPLARRNDQDPFITDRFEFFIGGREIANAFSELNDPEDQAERFKAQVAQKEAGNTEAMHYDEEYITALEYGMPPTAGEGIGIDRLVMLLTDSPSIKDVILFPQLRKREN